MVLGFPPELAQLGYLIMSLIISNSVMFLILVVVFITTRGVLPPIIKSKIRGKTLLVLLKKNRRLEFVAGDYGGGFCRNKG